MLVLVLPPARGSRRHRKMIYDTRAILSSSEHVAHACLIHIESTELRYLPFVLLPLVEFHMLDITIDMPLDCLALLGLGRCPLSYWLDLGRR